MSNIKKLWIREEEMGMIKQPNLVTPLDQCPPKAQYEVYRF